MFRIDAPRRTTQVAWACCGIGVGFLLGGPLAKAAARLSGKVRGAAARDTGATESAQPAAPPTSSTPADAPVHGGGEGEPQATRAPAATDDSSADERAPSEPANDAAPRILDRLGGAPGYEATAWATLRHRLHVPPSDSIPEESARGMRGSFAMERKLLRQRLALEAAAGWPPPWAGEAFGVVSLVAPAVRVVGRDQVLNASPEDSARWYAATCGSTDDARIAAAARHLQQFEFERRLLIERIIRRGMELSSRPDCLIEAAAWRCDRQRLEVLERGRSPDMDAIAADAERLTGNPVPAALDALR